MKKTMQKEAETMADREKVIAAYICQNEKLPDKRCEKCPYGYEYLDQKGDNYFVRCNTERIMVDAIDLLIAQEPRAMTSEEIRSLLAMPDILPGSGDKGGETVECTKVNCPMQAGTKTDNCSKSCPWKTIIKTGDLISRTASIEAIKPLLYSGNCVSTLINMPAVDAVPVVHGRWVYEHGDPMLMPCSVCGYQVYRYNNTHYCPNCGAKMDGE